MVFSSIPFLYYFLPCALLLYFLVGKSMKNLVLFLVSLVFYAWGEPRYVLVMLLSIVIGYIFGILIEHNRRQAKLCLAFCVCIILGILAYCKYMDFFISSINHIMGGSIPLLKVTLPVGISFYSFQIISYVVDVYRREVPAQKNFVHLGAYISMFPQLIAGPIVRYSDIASQLKTRDLSIDRAALGIRRFVLGLSKKVLIANPLGELCLIFKTSDDKSVLFFWIYAIAYTLHIYYDFSGYSDMAIGLGHIFGFQFPENFNYPYISKSITEFWRRWHISLGTWFRDYVYIPLGGNRVSKGRWFLNILIVWFLTGMWHGASFNFIAWGLLFAVFLILEKLWLLVFLKKMRVMNHIYVLLIVIIGFVLFDATDLTTANHYISSMFGLNGYSMISKEALYYLKSYKVVFLFAMLGATPVIKGLYIKMFRSNLVGMVVKWLEPIVLMLLMLIVTGYIVDGSFNPFLYFRF